MFALFKLALGLALLAGVFFASKEFFRYASFDTALAVSLVLAGLVGMILGLMLTK